MNQPQVKRYELIREIFNNCSGNQMRDVFVSEIETADPGQIARQYLDGEDGTVEKTARADGVLVYDVTAAGLRQRLSFTEV
ncbi:MAG: hypothetical protein LBC72_05530 [Spirochaetaceae bacterium]|jgi:hypothetical protein|nr:hypothetical protein [Spirochaetaceae bacterium]